MTTLTLLGDKNAAIPSDYTPDILEAFPNKPPGNDYLVTLHCPEFTSLCPITGQPGDFHEDCVNIIMKDLIRLMQPKYIEVYGAYTPRGGIAIHPYANYGQPGTRYAEHAAARLLNRPLTA